MARLWQLGVRETRPGTYFRTSSGDVTTVGATNGIVALVYDSNWGPLYEVVDISPEDKNNLADIVGSGEGYTSAYEALIGGARMVRAVRVGEGGTQSSRPLYAPDKTVTTTNPETGEKTTTVVKGDKVARVIAKYVGARQFYLSINTDLLTGNRQVSFFNENGKLIEKISYAAESDEATNFVNAIKKESKFFTAKRANGPKSKLADITQAKFSLGTDPTVKIESYAQGTEVLERYSWNIIIASRHSAKVNNLMASFVKQSYELGRLGMTVLGGVPSTALADRMAYAASINDWRVVYMLSGWYDNLGQSHNGYIGAARIAGMIAACESNASVTHLVIQDALKPAEVLTNGQMIEAEESGCMVLSVNDEGQIWIDNANNTLITLGNDQDEGWTKIRRTKCRFELMDRVNRTCDKLIGRLNNDVNGRATIVTAMQSVINEMISEGKLFLGSYAAEDETHQSVGDRAYFVLNIGDIDSMEKIYLDYRFSYANPFSETTAS